MMHLLDFWLIYALLSHNFVVFTRFFRRFVETENQNPQTRSLLECMAELFCNEYCYCLSDPFSQQFIRGQCPTWTSSVYISHSLWMDYHIFSITSAYINGAQFTVEYLRQFWFGQIHLVIWRDTFGNLERYIWQFGRMHFAIWANTLCNVQ